MASTFKIGDVVKQIVPVVQGTIVERTISGDDDVYKVSWINPDGETIESYIKEDDLELVV
jgi:hypothetical protein